MLNPESLSPVLAKRINILNVEDEPLMLAMISEIFDSPFITVYKAKTMRETDAVLHQAKKWHCWIIDLRLEENGPSGHKLLENHPEFPFSVVYSGLHSMEDAAKATRNGAAAVIDKGPYSLEKLVFEVCRVAPLAFLDKNELYTGKKIFWLLLDGLIKESHEWAEKAGISLRQLENITTTHTGMSPYMVISFYYGFRLALFSSLRIGKTAEAVSLFDKNRDFFNKCIFAIHRHLSFFQNHR